MANRKQQLKILQARIEVLAVDVELLLDELQNLFDEMSEKVQDGERGQALMEQIGTLEDWHGYLTDMAEADL